MTIKTLYKPYKFLFSKTPNGESQWLFMSIFFKKANIFITIELPASWFTTKKPQKHRKGFAIAGGVSPFVWFTYKTTLCMIQYFTNKMHLFGLCLSENDYRRTIQTL